MSLLFFCRILIEFLCPNLDSQLPSECVLLTILIIPSVSLGKVSILSSHILRNILFHRCMKRSTCCPSYAQFVFSHAQTGPTCLHHSCSLIVLEPITLLLGGITRLPTESLKYGDEILICIFSIS